jgi:thiamine-phosphate pyrophosphorylase
LVDTLGIPVWVNDRADVAWAARAAGVHVGADDIPVARLRSAAPFACSIGVSVGNEREASAALAGDPDYWSIGSVYRTGSKLDAGTPIGPEGLSKLAGRAPEGMPIVAIGGITVERVPEVIGSGAGGVAVIGAIFLEPDPERAARRLRDAVDAGRGS